MSSESGLSTATTHTAKTVAYALALFAWAEAFILVGLQYYWVLGKSYPLSTENWWTGVAAFSPLIVLLVVGLFASALRFRIALVQVEPWLHLTAGVLLFALIVGVTTYDPFDMLLPFSWTFHLWAVATCFVMLADMARLQRRSLEPPAPNGRTPWWPLAAATVVVGGIVLATALTTKSLVWCWAVGLVAHAIMAPDAARARLSTIALAPFKHRFLVNLTAVFEALTLALVILAMSLKTYVAHAAVGNPELKFQCFFQPYISVWFAGGVLLAVIAARFKLSWGVLAAVVVAAVWGPEHWGFLPPLLLGYALAALAIVVKRQGPLAYALSAVAMTSVWFVVFTFFVFAPIAGSLEPAKSIFEPIMVSCGKAILALFAVAAVCAVVQRFWKSAEAAPLAAPQASPAFCTALFVGALALAFLPSLGIIAYKSAPPLRLHRAERIAVKEPAGVCHAGYSNSDEEYAILQKLGVKTVRADFRWHTVQPKPDVWDFQRFDDYVAAAEKHGVKVLAILGFDNNAVEQDPVGKTRDLYIAPADLPLFEEYVRRVTARYKGRVMFEIWNEPSLDRFWTGTSAEFYELAKRTAAAVRVVDPKATIIGTAMHGPYGIWTPHQSAGLFAAGAMEQVDIPSFHLYIGDPRGYVNEFSKYDGINRAYGRTGPLAVTEIGDPDGGGYPWRATPAKLAEHVIKTHVAATSLGFADIVWYCFQESSAERQRKQRADSESFFGLLAPGQQWKPAAHAYRLFNTHCCNSTIRSDILERTGGLTARQVRATLYRRDNGDSTLILWYEPTLSGQDTVRVALTFDDLADTPVIHDIGSSYTKELLDDAVYVGERPTVITFRTANPEARVHVAVASAVADTMLLAVFAVSLLASAVACVAVRRA